MTDREKIIKALEKCAKGPLRRNADKYVVTLDIRFVNSILELLKEQAAVEPKRIDGKRNHFIKCGNCNYDLTTGFQFCPHCGREVKRK